MSYVSIPSVVQLAPRVVHTASISIPIVRLTFASPPLLSSSSLRNSTSVAASLPSPARAPQARFHIELQLRRFDIALVALVRSSFADLAFCRTFLHDLS